MWGYLTALQTDQPVLLCLSEDMYKLIKGKDKHIDGVIVNVLLYTLQSIRHTYVKCDYFSLVFHPFIALNLE